MRENLTIRLSAEEKQILQGIATQNGCTIGQAVRLLINQAASDRAQGAPDDQIKRKINRVLQLEEENNFMLRELCKQNGTDPDNARNQVKQNAAERFKARNGIKSAPAEKRLTEPEDLTQQMSINDFPETLPADNLDDSYYIPSVDDLADVIHKKHW